MNQTTKRNSETKTETERNAGVTSYCESALTWHTSGKCWIIYRLRCAIIDRVPRANNSLYYVRVKLADTYNTADSVTTMWLVHVEAQY